MKLSMTTREIAELTGKQHAHVMRDTREMLDSLGLSSFGESSYTNAQNRQMPMYELDRDLTMTLVTGYDVAMRHRVMKRWRELEEKEAGAPLSTVDLLRMAATWCSRWQP